MRVLRDLTRQRLAIGRWHPVVRLDALFGVNTHLKARRQRGVLDIIGFGFRGIERLRVHGRLPEAPSTYNTISETQEIYVTYHCSRNRCRSSVPGAGNGPLSLEPCRFNHRSEGPNRVR